MISAYPLQWPAHWPRTQHPLFSQFQTSLSEASTNLFRQLELMGATNIVINSNMQLRPDGRPYARQQTIDDTGVAVYFTLNGEQQCIPCDKWMKLEENVQAIRKTVEALRGLERWGAKEMVNAAFRGFKALPENVIVTPYTVRPWHEVLEVLPTASFDVIQAAYKRLLLRHHPDQGGDVVKFQELKQAYDQARKERDGH